MFWTALAAGSAILTWPAPVDASGAARPKLSVWWIQAVIGSSVCRAVCLRLPSQGHFTMSCGTWCYAQRSVKKHPKMEHSWTVRRNGTEAQGEGCKAIFLRLLPDAAGFWHDLGHLGMIEWVVRGVQVFVQPSCRFTLGIPWPLPRYCALTGDPGRILQDGCFQLWLLLRVKTISRWSFSLPWRKPGW